MNDLYETNSLLREKANAQKHAQWCIDCLKRESDHYILCDLRKQLYFAQNVMKVIDKILEERFIKGVTNDRLYRDLGIQRQ